jgi:uncharacterized Zn finger protein
MDQENNLAWGEQFFSQIEKIVDPAKLHKGRFYAQNDRIQSYSIKDGTIIAQIRGTVKPQLSVYKEPIYETSINIKQIKNTDWEKIISHIAAKASMIARIILGKLPNNIDSVFQKFGLSLFPQDIEDFSSECTCTNWETPCTHISGLLNLLANKINKNPFLLLELRGSSMAELTSQLSITPLGRILHSYFKVKENVLPIEKSYFTIPKIIDMTEDVTLDTIWEGNEPIPIDFSTLQPTLASALKIRTVGDNPSFWKEDNSFIETMEEIYARIKKVNHHLLSLPEV